MILCKYTQCQGLSFSGVFHSKPALFSCVPKRFAAQTATRNILDGELSGIKEAGTWKSERVISSPQGASINVQGQTANILNFCANNYLGLSVC